MPDKKMSAFTVLNELTDDAFIVFVANGQNCKISKADLIAAIGGGGTTPDLDAVTTAGGTTQNDVYLGSVTVRKGGINRFIADSNGNGGRLILTDSAGNYVVFLKAEGLTDDRYLLIPNKNGVLATLDDIASGATPTLQQVVTAGNSTTSDIVVHTIACYEGDDQYAALTQNSGGTGKGGALILKAKDSVNIVALIAKSLTSYREINVPNQDGNVAVVNAADNYANDAAAATGGILVGQCYHNAGAVRIRLA